MIFNISSDVISVSLPMLLFIFFFLLCLHFCSLSLVDAISVEHLRIHFPCSIRPFSLHALLLVNQHWLRPDVPPAEKPECPNRRNDAAQSHESNFYARRATSVPGGVRAEPGYHQRMFADAALKELAAFLRWRHAHRFQPFFLRRCAGVV